MQRKIFLASFILAFMASSNSPNFAQENYQSPYKFEFTFPLEELRQIDSLEPRNDWKRESHIPYEEWYSGRTRKTLGSWGPHARQYPALPDFEKAPLEWKRQRVLATAAKWTGRPYQHHHIPDWDPPADWPWKPVKYGRNSAGIDCSDFTSWAYNYGLGIKLKTAIGEQAQLKEITGPGGEGTMRVRTLEDDGGYDSLCKKLKAGDLLYIKNKDGKVSHVIMWAGEYGKSPDGKPLVIDSTGTGHNDSNGVGIPVGVHLRPFTKDSWYYHDFSHAHRILRAKED